MSDARLMRSPGSKERLKQFLLANVGKVVNSRQLRDAAGLGVSEWARRVRELREVGWPIRTHNDDAKLKPGEYVLEKVPPENLITFSRPISARLRAQVLDRNGFTCQMCGLAAGDIDPTSGRKVRLHLGHIKDRSIGGKDELSNLRALCSACNQGAKNVTAEKPTAIWLLTQVRRAGQDEQRAVFDWLQKKFSSR
jgi:5-methylcytosine-specific restriction endonuclease McrA